MLTRAQDNLHMVISECSMAKGGPIYLDLDEVKC